MFLIFSKTKGIFFLNLVSKFVLLFILFLALIYTFSSVTLAQNVSVHAEVPYTITIKVYPEKRIPLTGNWSNQNTITIRHVNSLTPIFSQAVMMNSNGEGTISTISSSTLPPGNYDIAIKGFSHLQRVYNNVNISTATVNLNFTAPTQLLLAGDTSLVEDNYINSLDLSNMFRNLYSDDLKNDLNRDSIVNSLDLSNLAYNFYKAGDN